MVNHITPNGHLKEWSYSDFKDLFGNGMAVGSKWEGGQVSMVHFAQ